MKTTTKTAPQNARRSTWGTSHFESFTAAQNYYSTYSTGNYAQGQALISEKLATGEIHIGPPTLKPGETLSLHTEERRYFITG